jgi:putative FmdB family regulatory protein
MPLYEYECDTCGHRFEVIQKFSDSPVSECPKCHGPVHKLFSSPAIQFKGSGWYITDYARKNTAAAGAAKGEGSGSSDNAAGNSGTGDTATKADSSNKTDSSTKSDSGTKKDSGKSDSGSKNTTTPSS